VTLHEEIDRCFALGECIRVGRKIASITLMEDVWGKDHPRNFVRR
jgi:hypothetical protein